MTDRHRRDPTSLCYTALAREEKTTWFCVHTHTHAHTRAHTHRENSPSINSVHIDILFSTKKALKKVMMYGESHCNQKKRWLWRRKCFNLSECCLIKKCNYNRNTHILKKQLLKIDLSFENISPGKSWSCVLICSWVKSGLDHVFCMEQPQNWPCKGFLIQTWSASVIPRWYPEGWPEIQYICKTNNH